MEMGEVVIKKYTDRLVEQFERLLDDLEYYVEIREEEREILSEIKQLLAKLERLLVVRVGREESEIVHNVFGAQEVLERVKECIDELEGRITWGDDYLVKSDSESF
jgi:iron-sulfur cluster repair protein YtfE (RIC family)